MTSDSRARAYTDASITYPDGCCVLCLPIDMHFADTMSLCTRLRSFGFVHPNIYIEKSKKSVTHHRFDFPDSREIYATHAEGQN